MVDKTSIDEFLFSLWLQALVSHPPFEISKSTLFLGLAFRLRTVLLFLPLVRYRKACISKKPVYHFQFRD